MPATELGDGRGNAGGLHVEGFLSGVGHMATRNAMAVTTTRAT